MAIPVHLSLDRTRTRRLCSGTNYAGERLNERLIAASFLYGVPANAREHRGASGSQRRSEGSDLVAVATAKSAFKHAKLPPLGPDDAAVIVEEHGDVRSRFPST